MSIYRFVENFQSSFYVVHFTHFSMLFDIVVITTAIYYVHANLESTGTLKQKCLDVSAIHKCSVFIYQII